MDSLFGIYGSELPNVDCLKIICYDQFNQIIDFLIYMDSMIIFLCGPIAYQPCTGQGI